MENIRQAVERAKAHSLPQPTRTQFESLGRNGKNSIEQFGVKPRDRRVELNINHLQSNRIVAYDGQDPRSRAFDVLRTEVLRSMDLKGWKTLAVTSPTASCGKTLTATNLALSIARQPERKVRLVDLDLRKPRVADSLGLDCTVGLISVLDGSIDVESAMIDATVGSSRLEVLPTGASTKASDLIASNGLRALLEDLAECEPSRLVIFDLPPLLTGHDAISILPQVDCVLLVAAVGVSRVSEVEECYRYLQETNLVRCVLNKAPRSPTSYAYY